MPAAVAIRDTDADWRALGAREPYWGVLTHPSYLAANLTAEALEAFYATGRDYIEGIVGRLEAVTGVRPAGRALDFGCGAGRLTEAMCAYAEPVTGVDISPGMLAKARERGGRGVYVETLPEGPFDWINSFIVLQHIPPERGMALIDELLARLAPGAHLSLHVTFWRDARHAPAKPAGLRARLFPGSEESRLAALPAGTMIVYDYDLGEVVKRITQAGVAELTLVSTDHDGHHGAILLGRKSA